MSLFKSTRLIKRSQTGSYIKGQWVKDAPGVDEEFLGTAQPAPGRVMELLPEGKRNREVIQVFAPLDIEFTAADDEKQILGDIVVWRDCEYEVQSLKRWDNGLLPHWELFATKV